MKLPFSRRKSADKNSSSKSKFEPEIRKSHINSRGKKFSGRRRLTIGVILVLIGFVIAVTVTLLVADARGYDFSDIRSRLSGLWSREDESSGPDKKLVCVDTDVNPTAAEVASQIADGESDDSVEFEIKTYEGSPSDDCDFDVSAEDRGDYDLVWEKYYVLVAAYGDDRENITEDELKEMLGGDRGLVVDDDARDFAERKYGIGINVEARPDGNSVPTGKVALIPFEKAAYNMLGLDFAGASIFDKTSDDSAETSTYALKDQIWLHEPEQIGLFNEIQSAAEPLNFDPEKTSTVITTGTSVMGSRKQYLEIAETGDQLFPSREVSSILSEADITHVSNEAPFTDSCQQAHWTMVFCGTTASFQNFEESGVDVVGLTGNHILDYGDEAFISTLELYENAGMKYFGGGRNAADAYSPATYEINGTKVAFLGYNEIPPATSYADENSPGSAYLDKNRMIADIKSAKESNDIVIVDMQWGAEYEREPSARQLEYGHAAVDAGADIVQGVHPHWVKPVEFYKNGVIFYSLGNFWFDQMWSTETREGIIVKHNFYDGAYMGFKIIPVMTFENAQPRPVDGADAERIKGYLF